MSEWLEFFGPLLVTLYWMVGLGIVFAVLTRLFPCNPGMSFWKDRRSFTTDLMYWFIMPFLFRLMRIALLMCGVALVFDLNNKEALQDFFLHGYGPVSQLPLWLQAGLILVLADIYMYWVHRFFHTRLAWNYHAIHHSTKQLDWISTQRFHIVNSVASFAVPDVVLLLCGFAPAAFVLLAPFNIAYSALVHANLNWTFGPFRYVLASPVFHRWHHTAAKEGGNKNFAPTFPVLDLMFGTYYMPKGKLPANYGVSDPHFPDDFIGQFMYPFRVRKG